MAHEKASSAAMSTPNATPIIHPNDLARDLHSSGDYFLVDCRPVLAYNSCHISGAVNVNFTGMMKKRFIAGKIGLTDLVTTAEGKEKFKVSICGVIVVHVHATIVVTVYMYMYKECLLLQLPVNLVSIHTMYMYLHPTIFFMYRVCLYHLYSPLHCTKVQVLFFSRSCHLMYAVH